MKYKYIVWIGLGAAVIGGAYMISKAVTNSGGDAQQAGSDIGTGAAIGGSAIGIGLLALALL
jgi:hypothetical protein